MSAPRRSIKVRAETWALARQRVKSPDWSDLLQGEPRQTQMFFRPYATLAEFFDDAVRFFLAAERVAACSGPEPDPGATVPTENGRGHE